ncbi:hypothetical protein SCP_1601560 [Sparassis crispa]|uniref:Uncharacterized protein n=1 Tax=Sparassis crispa TaxID=139825 RepID=A0A401H4Z7_9APHY|nr:hypothetical protein SCP_1601560 [Sparassis crispa]GBE89494.1 hypothetical protein SCP_1601560 [Sparassis crispa]
MVTGITGLPVLGMKGSPKKFKGSYAEVARFLQHYEWLCAQLNIVTAEDQVENVMQYCARSVRQFMESLSAYVTPDWNAFKRDVLTFYDADRDKRQYKVKDLEALVKESHRKPTIKNLGAWWEYSRNFLTVAGWLVNCGRISEVEQSLYFWKGVPRAFRQDLEPCLLAADPNHDMFIPFSMSSIRMKAKTILQCNRFHQDQLPSEDEDSSDDSDDADSDDDSSDSEDSSSAEETHRQKCKDKKKKQSMKK